MTSGPAGFGVDLEAIEAFADKMGRHIEDLQDQLAEFARADLSRLKLGSSAEAKRQVLHHESVWEEYLKQLSRLCEAYERARDLTLHLLKRYRAAEETVDEAQREVERRLDAATRVLPDIRQ